MTTFTFASSFIIYYMLDWWGGGGSSLGVNDLLYVTCMTKRMYFQDLGCQLGFLKGQSGQIL